MYADSDGRSRIDSARIDLLEDEPGQLEGRRFEWSDPSKPIPFSDPWTAKQVNFWRYPVGHSAGWHNPPERVFLVILSGAAEVGVSTGEAFVMGV